MIVYWGKATFHSSDMRMNPWYKARFFHFLQSELFKSPCQWWLFVFNSWKKKWNWNKELYSKCFDEICKTNLGLQLCELVQIALGRLSLLQCNCHLENSQLGKPTSPHGFHFYPCYFHLLSQILTPNLMIWCTLWSEKDKKEIL